MLIKGDCEIELPKIESDSINLILTDPPYLYLDHDLDLEFNEDLIFKEYKRILKDKGFLIIFGRGSSFYRWCYKLETLGFIFKEEVIWYKENISSPLGVLGRIHETIAVFTFTGVLNKIKTPYLETRITHEEWIKVKNDIKRIISSIGNVKELENIKEYLETGNIGKDDNRTQKHSITIKQGYSQKRFLNSLQSIKEGLIVKSVIKINREHYDAEHPTQKPIDLLELLIKITSNSGDKVLDSFMGGGSTGVACHRTDRDFIGIEINEDYFKIATQRIKKTKGMFVDL